MYVELRFDGGKGHGLDPGEKDRWKDFTNVNSYAESDHSFTYQAWGQFTKNLSYQQISQQKSKQIS